MIAKMDRMDDVFKALADPSRRLLLDSLNMQNGQTLSELVSRLEMTRQSVSKHLAQLEAANLVTTVWRGREKLHYLNAEPINALSDRWIKNYDRDRVTALADLKNALENRTVNDAEFVYTTYIEAPPELVWRGLTDPSFTRRYWGVEFQSDWKPGSTFTLVHGRRGIAVTDAEMIVKAYDPYTRLSYTWQAYPKELTDSIGFAEGFYERALAEPRSTVNFELEPRGTQTKLTVVHTGFEPGSVVLPDISGGWPKVLSWLKTFLESGAYENADTPAVR
jgi:uncharacterized protein YndB with AHSA1/START domain/DNA-binding transcriptional ArsR family regulator